MYFKSFMEFLQMGGYAPYVWAAYGITAIILIANVLIPLLDKARHCVRFVKNHEFTA